MFLERTASNSRPPLKYFTNHPDSITILEIIIEMLKEMPAASRLSGPSLPPSFSPNPLSPYQIIIEESASKSTSSPNTTFLNAVSLASIKALDTSSHSISQVYDTDDRYMDEYFGQQSRGSGLIGSAIQLQKISSGKARRGMFYFQS